MTEDTRILDVIDKVFDDYMWMTQDPENAIETAIRQHHEFMKERVKHEVLMALYKRGTELYDIAWREDVTTEEYKSAREKSREIAFQLTGKHEGEW
jgi:hypothetical protein